MKRRQVIFLTILVGVAALLMVGCEEERTWIHSILDSPRHFYDKEVIIAGTVTDTSSGSVFFGGDRAYEVDDGTGRIWVITRDRLPDRRDEVGLRGRVDGGIRMFGGRAGVVIREHERRIRHSNDRDRRDWERERDRDRDRDRDYYLDRDRDKNRDRDRDYPDHH